MYPGVQIIRLIVKKATNILPCRQIKFSSLFIVMILIRQPENRYYRPVIRFLNLPGFPDGGSNFVNGKKRSDTNVELLPGNTNAPILLFLFIYVLLYIFL